MATVGTTSSGAVDPLRPIGEICRRHGVWLHVDAAWAGTAALLLEKRWILDGVEHADSFVFNPHKWMLTNFDCSAYFVKDPGSLVRAFEIHPEYLKTGVDAKVKNYRDWGIQLGRRFRALKLWFVIRSYGVEGLQAMVREHLRLAGLVRNGSTAMPEAFTYSWQTLGYSAPQGVAMPAAGSTWEGDVEIAGGRFVLGAVDDGSFVFDNEKWGHAVVVQPFRMARAPVTNAGFAEFVEAGGYRKREWWSAAGWSWREHAAIEAPRYWQNPAQAGRHGILTIRTLARA